MRPELVATGGFAEPVNRQDDGTEDTGDTAAGDGPRVTAHTGRWRRRLTTATILRRQSRRAFVGTVVFGGAAAILAACAPAAAPTAPAPPPTKAAAAASPTTAASAPAAAPAKTGTQPVTLEVLFQSGIVGSEKLWEQIGTEYTAKTGHKINAVLVPHPDAESKVLTSMAGRVPVDLIYVHPTFNATFSSKGAVADLDPYMKAVSKAEAEDYYYGATAWFTWEGKQYALPVISAPNAVYYNADLIQKAGLADPWELYKKGEWTTAKFDDYLPKLSNGEGANRVYGVAEIDRSIRYQVQWLWGHGGEVYNDKLTETVIHSDAAVKGWEYLAGLVTKRFAPGRAESSALTNTVGVLNSGRVAMAYGWRTLMASLKPDMKWGLAPLFKMADGKEYNRNGPNGIGITSWSKEPSQAWELLRFLSTRGVEIFVAGGASIPTTKSFGNSPAWKGALLPWEPAEVYDIAYKQMETRPTLPFPPGANNIDTLIQSAFDRVVLGEATAKQAMTDAKPKIDAVLKEMAVK
jgi:multiple sugar transport system substrate-binding protein